MLSWCVEKGFGESPKGLSLNVYPARMLLPFLLMGPALLTEDIANSILMLVPIWIVTARKLVV